jgi:hypothetical protein
MSTLYIERFGISFYSVDARARWNGGGIKLLSVWRNGNAPVGHCESEPGDKRFESFHTYFFGNVSMIGHAFDHSNCSILESRKIWVQSPNIANSILAVEQSAEMLAQTHYGDTLLTANSIFHQTSLARKGKSNTERL